MCETLLSDRRKNFTYSLLKDIYEVDIYGQVENFHRTLHQILASSIEAGGGDWEEWADYVLWAHRAQPHSVTKYPTDSRPRDDWFPL
jgi:hypothetical protein